MVGAFDSLATTLTDLGNAAVNVINVLATGNNAGIIITGAIVIALVVVALTLPRHLEKWFNRRM